MPSIAVIGGDTRIGTRVVAALRDNPQVARLVVIGARVMPQPDVEAYAVDIASTDLKPFLDGIEVIIDCATHVDPMPETDLLDRMTVTTADNVLRAANGATRYIAVSTAAVYGAWANNATPLAETALVRPNPGFGPATRAAEIERRLFEWGADHPQCAVVILRPAPVVAPGDSDLLALLLAGRPPVVARGADPEVQVAHVDDVAAAVVAAVFGPLTGVYNVASPGAVDAATIAALLPGRTQVRLPEELLARGLDVLWASGAGDVPAAALPYLRADWTLDTAKLEAAGWSAQYSNADAIRACLPYAVYTLPPAAKRALIAAGAVVAGSVLVAAWAWSRRRRSAR